MNIKKYLFFIIALLLSIKAFATNYNYQLINGIYYSVENLAQYGSPKLVAKVADVANPSSITELTIPQTIKVNGTRLSIIKHANMRARLML